MFYAAVWAIVLILLACWSGLVWVVQSLLGALLAHAGKLSSGEWSLPEPLAAALPRWAADWLSGELETWAPQLQSLFGTLPDLSGSVTVLAWVAWTLGALPLLLGGVAGHVAVASWLRSRLPAPVPG